MTDERIKTLQATDPMYRRFRCNANAELFVQALGWALRGIATEGEKNYGRPWRKVGVDLFNYFQTIPDIDETDAGGMVITFNGYIYSSSFLNHRPIYGIDPDVRIEEAIEFHLQPTGTNTIIVAVMCLGSIWEEDYNQLINIIADLYPEAGLKVGEEQVVMPAPAATIEPLHKNPLPESPPMPNANGYTWNDFFDWCYRQPRKISVEEMANMLAKGKRTIEREKSNYQAEYGKQAIPNDKSKFSA